MFSNELKYLDDCFYTDDDYNLNLYVRDNYKNAIDITGYTVAMQFRQSVLYDTPDVDISYVVDSNDGPIGLISITVPAATTVNLVPSGKQKRIYDYDVRITDTVGQTSTILKGRTTVFQSTPT